MTQVTRIFGRVLLAGGVGAAALLWNGNLPIGSQTALVSTADALVGRPATPRSFAGVARRTAWRAGAIGVGAAAGYAATRAAVGYTAARATATGVAVVGATAAHGCARVIGPLGRAFTVCR